MIADVYLKDKAGKRRPIAWDMYCIMMDKVSGYMDVYGKPLLFTTRTRIAGIMYFDLVDGGFLDETAILPEG